MDNIENHIANELVRLNREIELLKTALRGATGYIELLDRNLSGFPYSLHQLRDAKEMLPIWRAALNQQTAPIRDIKVQCTCGWKGMQSAVAANDKRCPRCSKPFVTIP